MEVKFSFTTLDNNSEVIDVTSNQGYLVSATPTLKYEYKGVTGVSIYG